MADPEAPSTTPRPAGSGMGCLVALLALPIVILVGIVVGSVLGGDEGTDVDEQRATLDEGEVDGTAWRVDGVVDVEGDTCAFLYEDGEQLTGACDPTPQDATFGDTTVVFGVAPSGAQSVAVELSDGEVVEAAVVEPGSLDGSFYVTVVDRDVDAVGIG